MKLQTKARSLLVAAVWILLLTGCAASTGGTDGEANDAINPFNDTNSVTDVSDVVLLQRVQAAIANAADVPQQLQVEANNGVVRLTGSLQCESCSGNETPGGAGTVQQSIGAVVRAVPGVSRVEFALDGAP